MYPSFAALSAVAKVAFSFIGTFILSSVHLGGLFILSVDYLGIAAWYWWLLRQSTLGQGQLRCVSNYLSSSTSFACGCHHRYARSYMDARTVIHGCSHWRYSRSFLFYQQHWHSAGRAGPCLGIFFAVNQVSHWEISLGASKLFALIWRHGQGDLGKAFKTEFYGACLNENKSVKETRG